MRTVALLLVLMLGGPEVIGLVCGSSCTMEAPEQTAAVAGECHEQASAIDAALAPDSAPCHRHDARGVTAAGILGAPQSISTVPTVQPLVSAADVSTLPIAPAGARPVSFAPRPHSIHLRI